MMGLLTSSDNDDQANPLLRRHAGEGALDIVADTITQDRYNMNYSVHLDRFLFERSLVGYVVVSFRLLCAKGGGERCGFGVLATTRW